MSRTQTEVCCVESLCAGWTNSSVFFTTYVARMPDVVEFSNETFFVVLFHTSLERRTRRGGTDVRRIERCTAARARYSARRRYEVANALREHASRSQFPE